MKNITKLINEIVKEVCAREISTKERNAAPKTSYVDSERRSFPILKKEDVGAAVHAWGRYKGKMSFEQFKAKLTRMAKDRGWESELPDEWKSGGDKNKK